MRRAAARPQVPLLAVVLAMVVVVVLQLGTTAAGDEHTHRFKRSERVVAWANHIGPYANPHETYAYFDLPFCSPLETVIERAEGLGEALSGNELVHSGIEFSFLKNESGVPLCRKTFDLGEVRRLRFAVTNHYWYQFYVDDLPFWGMVGEHVHDQSVPEARRTRIFTHRRFHLEYNGPWIIGVSVEALRPEELVMNHEFAFTYDVVWTPTNVTFAKRWHRYLDARFFEHHTHTFAVMNSFVLVLMMVGVVVLLLAHVLKRDFSRYVSIEDGTGGGGGDVDDSGWKQVHGDVFRQPAGAAWMAAGLGTGAQLTVNLLSVLAYATLDETYSGRGEMLSIGIINYLAMAPVAGWISGKWYHEAGGQAWIRVMLLTAALFPATAFVAAIAVNTVAARYSSLSAVPFGTMTIVVVLWAVVQLPLTALGTLLGRNCGSDGPDAWPCRVLPTPRAVPAGATSVRWLLSLGAGLLPFLSIFIELYYVAVSFWSYKYFFVYSLALLSVIFFFLVVACVAVVVTYVVLAREDWHWPWTAWRAGASVGLYTYAYAAYFFHAKTRMTGGLQTAYYFIYSLLMCLGVALAAAFVAYAAAAAFVRRIYAGVKVD